ncbi:phosphotransferase [Spongiactinospora sp. TRM90649]|uniref:phosphotransferase n=1 Tax=Spongiactinospora sp. TRM90649 TaxID=3031114 RepID=UPI0023F7FEA8|nr:phosphotransferase [Spongiactinospora sp. TRM90649]MDF5751890.1 phosphotransferase [Spongiactinospora sp. TRM90649]
MPDLPVDPIRLVTAWAGRPVTVTEIKGGLSHRIARVDTGDGECWLMRVLDPRVSEAGLGIPLEQEIANTACAARGGVGPRVVHRIPDHPVLLLEFLDGRTLDAAAVRDPDMIPEIARACRRLHAGPRFANDFSIFRKLEELLALCHANGLPVPDGHADRLPVIADMERALTRWPLPAVPCHNDLLPENFIAMADGSVRIVDYQLSGNHDPTFELGDIAAEADYPPELVSLLAASYFGEHDRRLLARVRLYLAMSNFTWTLWFAVHHGLLSEQAAAADFDYAAEAADKFQQAVRDMDDPGFGRLIDDVRGLPPV